MTRRSRRGRKRKPKPSQEENRREAAKKALGISKEEILPHIIGRGRWRGMRDYAPEENGPVIVRKQERR